MPGLARTDIKLAAVARAVNRVALQITLDQRGLCVGTQVVRRVIFSVDPVQRNIIIFHRDQERLAGKNFFHRSDAYPLAHLANSPFHLELDEAVHFDRKLHRQFSGKWLDEPEDDEPRGFLFRKAPSG